MEHLFLKTVIAIIILGFIYFLAKKKNTVTVDLAELPPDHHKVLTFYKKRLQEASRIIKEDLFENCYKNPYTYIDLFKKWQQTQASFFRNATKSQRKIYYERSRINQICGYGGQYQKFSPSKDDYELVMENCFTRPFYAVSYHEDDSLAINDLIMQFMVFEIIEKLKSQDYYIHRTQCFLNTHIAACIIMVDLYKKKPKI